MRFQGSTGARTPKTRTHCYQAGVLKLGIVQKKVGKIQVGI